jgi:apolipoprotein N-acyltransferase
LAIEAEMADAPTLRVAIVQSNVPVGGLSAPVKLARLQEPSARAERAGAELVIWPEAGAYPYGIARPFEHDRELGRGRVLSHHRVPTIFGANTRVPGERFGYNSVFHLDADGKVTGGYDKVNLVPLGESIPLIDPDWVTDRIPQIAHHERGEEPARFFVAGRDAAGDRALFPVAPLICYEDIIPSFVRRAAAQAGGVDLFVNVTIDAWYGDSAEPWEHLALAQFRSVEHRVPMVRSVSTGVSAVIDAAGRLGEHIPLRPVSRETLDRYPPELLVADVALARNTAARPTPFARFGWTFVPLCQLAALATAGGWYFRRRSRDLARVEGRD